VDAVVYLTDAHIFGTDSTPGDNSARGTVLLHELPHISRLRPKAPVIDNISVSIELDSVSDHFATTAGARIEISDVTFYTLGKSPEIPGNVFGIQGFNSSVAVRL
jgi:hypothetical protein